jgi:hypothetical protein
MTEALSTVNISSSWTVDSWTCAKAIWRVPSSEALSMADIPSSRIVGSDMNLNGLESA